MVVVKFFGALDLLAVLVLGLLHYSWLSSWNLILFVSAYLLIKGVLFRGSIHSWLDIICGVWVIIVALGAHTLITFIFGGYLLQKSLSSLAA